MLGKYVESRDVLFRSAWSNPFEDTVFGIDDMRAIAEKYAKSTAIVREDDAFVFYVFYRRYNTDEQDKPRLEIRQKMVGKYETMLLLVGGIKEFLFDLEILSHGLLMLILEVIVNTRMFGTGGSTNGG